MTDKLTWTNQVRKLSDLTPWPRNPRQIDAEQAERLGESWDTFGQVETLAIGPDNQLYDGHQRLKVLAEQHGPDYEVDVRVSSRALDEKEREKLTVMLVKASGEWDWDLLGDWDAEDLVEWGFDEGELEAVDFGDDDAAVEDVAPQIDKAAELQEVWGTALGQIWELGAHRLACGDCTDEAVVAAVMDGEKANMVFTDPPYGIDYQDVQGNFAKIAGDKELAGVEPLLQSALAINCPIFVCCNWLSYSVFFTAFENAGRKPKACIVWDKLVRIQNLDRFGKQHEFVLYHGPFGGEPTVDVDVWQCKRETSSSHPTAKPVEVVERAMRSSSLRGGIVYDPFLGSGTTLIACERLGRKCRAIEIDPRYVAVALDRFYRATGKTPKLVT